MSADHEGERRRQASRAYEEFFDEEPACPGCRERDRRNYADSRSSEDMLAWTTRAVAVLVALGSAAVVLAFFVGRSWR